MSLKILTAAVVCLCLASAASAQVPNILNYQGRVTVGGTNLTTNAALFKFALVDSNGSTVYWRNDGSTAGGEPSSAVSVPVAQGLYSTLLGDTSLANMAAMPAAVFSNANVNLRVWFSAGGTNPFVQVAPDQQLGASGYALRAAVADNIAVTGTLTAAQLIGGTGSTASGAYATVSGGSTNTASGFAAFVGGGQQNANSGDLAAIGGGEFNRIESSAQHSVIAGGLSNSIDTNASFAYIAGGQGALASLYGQAAHATGSFVTKGDAQATEYVLRGETAGAVTNVLFLDGVSKRLTIIKPKQTLVFDVTVAARNTGTANAGYQLRAMADRTGSSIYLNGSSGSLVDVTPIYEDRPTWKVQLKPNSATSSVDVEVIGEAGNTIRWVAVIRATEVYIPQ